MMGGAAVVYFPVVIGIGQCRGTYTRLPEEHLLDYLLAVIGERKFQAK